MSKPTITRQQRQAVAHRAQHCCEYCCCQAKFSSDSFSVEHIIPRSKEGSSSLENLALACQGCNNRKFTHTEAYDPVSGQKVALYNPRHHIWKDHFIWNEDLTQILGVTPIGRATVNLLQLNRPGIVNLRRVLASQGEHPP